MLVGRCSSKLSGHELHAKSKKSQAPTGNESGGQAKSNPSRRTYCYTLYALGVFFRPSRVRPARAEFLGQAELTLWEEETARV
jgi:hypothetical protein